MSLAWSRSFASAISSPRRSQRGKIRPALSRLNPHLPHRKVRRNCLDLIKAPARLGRCHRSVTVLGRGVGELGDGSHYPPPGHLPSIIASESELISSDGAFLDCLLAVALAHQLRRSPNVDLGYHTAKTGWPASLRFKTGRVTPQADGRYGSGKVSRLKATMIWRARCFLIGGIALIAAGGSLSLWAVPSKDRRKSSP